jgi:hypothetical protein
MRVPGTLVADSQRSARRQAAALVKGAHDMKHLGRTVLCALGLTAALAATPARADLGDDLFATGGNIVIRFEGSNAGYSSLISVNGSAEMFPNKSTPAGTELDLGFFSAGTPLDIVLHVINTGQFFHTGPGTLNSDGLPHAFVEVVGDRTFVGFEDLVGGGDRDYNDHMFSFTNIAVSAIPEPSTLALMAAGFGALGFIGRRRRGSR